MTKKTQENGNRQPRTVTRHFVERLSAYGALALPPEGRDDASSTTEPL